MAIYLVYILISFLIAIPLISLGNTSLGTTNQPFLLKTTGDWIWVGTLIGTTIIATIALYLARKQKSFADKAVMSLGIPVILGNIALVVVSLLVKSYKHYSSQKIKTTLQMIDASYAVACVIAILMVIVVFILNYRNGWLKKNNWVAFISAAPGLGLLAVMYRHWSSWHQFITSRDFSNFKFSQMMNDFAALGAPMNLVRANEPAYVLTYFGPLLTYIILLIGGVVLVQKAEEKFKKRRKI